MYTFVVVVEPISAHRHFIPYEAVLTLPTPSFDKAVKKALKTAEQIYKYAPIIRFEIPVIKRLSNNEMVCQN